jgi:transposase-like protein
MSISKSKYIESGGAYCPRCESVELLVYDIQSDDDGIAEQSIHCEDCSLTWINEYVLTDISYAYDNDTRKHIEITD